MEAGAATAASGAVPQLPVPVPAAIPKPRWALPPPPTRRPVTVSNSGTPAPPPAAAPAPEGAPPIPSRTTGTGEEDEEDAAEEVITEVRAIEGQGWDLVQLRKLAVRRSDGTYMPALLPPPEVAPAGTTTSAASAGTGSAGNAAPLPPQPTMEQVWTTTTGIPSEADWVRHALNDFGTVGNGPLPNCPAHLLSRSNLRIDGATISL